jgi:hypothetical protein
MSTKVQIDRESLSASTERALRDSGNSKVVSLPPQLLQAAGFDEDEDVIVRADMETGTIRIEQMDSDGSDGD